MKEKRMCSGVREQQFIQGKIFPAMLMFAVPVFFSSLFQQFYNMADTMIIGYTLGETSLAAMGSASAIYDLLIGFALGMGNGMSIVVARCFGTGDQARLKRAVAATIVIGTILTLSITVLGQFILRPMLEMLHTPENVIEEAYQYISMITLFSAIIFAYNLCAGILRAVGNSMMPLLFLILASCLNVVLDILFIVPLKMGVGGAALATVLAQGISVLLCLWYIKRKLRMLIPSRAHFFTDSALYREMTLQGLSFGLMEGIYRMGSVFLQSGINSLGYLTIAGHTAARKVFQVTLMPFTAMNSACNMFVSQNRGADKPERIRKGVLYVCRYHLVMTVIMTALIWPFAPVLISLVSGSVDAVIVQNGAAYLRVAAPCYIILGILNISRGTLQALGEKILPLFSSMIELIGKILFMLLLIPRFQYQAVIFCEPVIWCFMVAELLWALWKNPYMKKAKI